MICVLNFPSKPWFLGGSFIIGLLNLGKPRADAVTFRRAEKHVLLKTTKQTTTTPKTIEFSKISLK